MSTYKDRWIECTDTDVRVRGYYFPWGTKRFAYASIRALRRVGFAKIVMLTGDHADVAKVVGAVLGVDRVFAERSPAEKVEAVRAAREGGVTVMVGDGINDAPALAAADVGVAMGARGATASSEAADVVLIVDRLDRLIEAVRIARRSRSIAIQSIVAGMALSAAGMALATAGVLQPVAGAILQEVIDVVVILNARARSAAALSGAPRISCAPKSASSSAPSTKKCCPA